MFDGTNDTFQERKSIVCLNFNSFNVMCFNQIMVRLFMYVNEVLNNSDKGV